MPRKTRKELVGDEEDIERTNSERKLARLEDELHEKWESQTPADVAETEEPADRDSSDE